MLKAQLQIIRRAFTLPQTKLHLGRADLQLRRHSFEQGNCFLWLPQPGGYPLPAEHQGIRWWMGDIEGLASVVKIQ